MNLAYPVRFAGLCLACFFLLHLVLGTAMATAAPMLVRRAARLRAAVAARIVLLLRFAPPAAAAVLVAGICVPSYLWMEPETGTERVGPFFVTASWCGLAIWTIAAARALGAIFRSLRFLRRRGIDRSIRGSAMRIRVIEDDSGVLALAGVLHPRLFVSRRLMECLPHDQITAALRHERAHQGSHDNLKRLFLVFAPGLLPFFRGFDSLERAWARFAEWAADDQAADGDPQRSLSLAAALVHVARMQPAGPPSFVTSLMGSGQDLSARVERLLSPEHPVEISRRVAAAGLWAGAILLAVLMTAMSPGKLAAVHGLLEKLVN
jgi:Zn-dependent protease with chaperone function